MAHGCTAPPFLTSAVHGSDWSVSRPCRFAPRETAPVTQFFLVGWDLRHQVLRPLLAYCTAPYDRWGWLWSNWWNEDWQGKPKYSEKSCPSAILSITNPTWPHPCANTGRRGGKPATNRLSYGAAVTVRCRRSYFAIGKLTNSIFSINTPVWIHMYFLQNSCSEKFPTLYMIYPSF
jgi:hypothetical protein